MIKGNSGSYLTPPRDNGFTLIEVLIAVAIAAILITALYTTFFSVIKATKSVEEGLEDYSDAGRLLDRLGMEARSAFFKIGDEVTLFKGEKQGGSSILSFTTFSGPMLDGTGRLSAVSYFTQEDGGRLTLYKEVWDPFTKKKLRFEVLKDIEGFEVSFLDEDWAGAWDARLEKRGPKALKAVVRLKGGAVFTSTVEVMAR